MKASLYFESAHDAPCPGVREVTVPDVLVQPGEVYEATIVFHTLAKVAYGPGDRFTILSRSHGFHRGRKCSVGNLQIKCKHFESMTWTCFEIAIADGWVKKVEA